LTDTEGDDIKVDEYFEEFFLEDYDGDVEPVLSSKSMQMRKSVSKLK